MEINIIKKKLTLCMELQKLPSQPVTKLPTKLVPSHSLIVVQIIRAGAIFETELAYGCASNRATAVSVLQRLLTKLLKSAVKPPRVMITDTQDYRQHLFTKASGS